MKHGFGGASVVASRDSDTNFTNLIPVGRCCRAASVAVCKDREAKPKPYRGEGY